MVKYTQLSLYTISIVSSTLFGQWSGDASNLLICGASGEQAQSKVAILEDGSSYISWFDNRSGGYDLYMQYLDASGQAMLDEDGTVGVIDLLELIAAWGNCA